MLFWIIIGGMTAAAMGLLLRPLLRGGRAEERPAAPDLAIYRDQLAEIERDVGSGLLSPEEAAAARLEVERRILAAAPAESTPATTPPRRHRGAAAALAVALPLLALGLYLQLGAPNLAHLPGTADPVRMTQAPGEATEANMGALVERLAQRMAEDPSNLEGWLLLGRSYGTLGRYREAAAAYEEAIARGADGAEVQSAYGEALTAAQDGQVTEPAVRAFEAALAADPAEPRARFYLALARAQAGRLDEALAMWVALEADTPADSPARAVIGAQIDQVARQLGRDPAELPGRVAEAAPPEMPAPSAEDMQTAEAMSPEDRAAFIRGMVERLAARLQDSPDDLDGWVRLARSYEVLEEAEAARDAWQRATALAPNRVDLLLGYAGAILAAGPEGAPLPEAFGETVDRVRALDPKDPLGLYFSGLAAAEAGDTTEARDLWTALLAQLPEGSAEHADLQRRIEALAGGS
ncbi:c-type cytochrome biogenesis protein CcmI [Rhodospirillaceae bacterium SYSU D60014]|uniref:c-type cytochrome biogenesis protein CcmI n=1 Tax=Virgifigura deserti TaxID=2268457 RepID=UPI000E662882